MIIADNVSVFYRRRAFRPKLRALDGFSLEVQKGDIYGLLGPNGAGKSTAMYCFLGLVRPDHGSISLLGESPDPGSPNFEKIAYVPEEPHYHLFLTVLEAMRFYAGLYRNTLSRSQVDYALERVGLSEYRDLKLEKCSKGMKQKLGIATCLLNKPELVFLDEPTRGLDPIIVKEFRDIITEMNNGGTTFIINSHILSEVEMVCNRVAIMDHGKVKLQDKLGNLLKYDLERYVIEIDSIPDAPPFIIEQRQEAGHIRGIVIAAEIDNFFKFAGERKLKVYECSLKRLTLEEAFFNVLNKERAHE
jgi:ABC-2 type transport system ATP-binding protein